jgi:calcineurin-like phosphoesterase family protein
MNTYVIADTHFNHGNIDTYCDRPLGFTHQLMRNWQKTIQPKDLIIHIGDVFIGKTSGWLALYPLLPGRKILVRGNHDRKHSNGWWMDHGFDFACDGFKHHDIWFSHEPAEAVLHTWGCPNDCELNIHGHLHNIWHGFHKNSKPGDCEFDTFQYQKLNNPWQRLFAVEYTNYMPVNLDKFLSHPDRYQARGPKPGVIESIDNGGDNEN